MVYCGVSENTIWDALKRQRQGLVSCWDHIKEGQSVFIKFESLRDNYKQLIQDTLCGGNNVYEFVSKSAIKDFLKEDEKALKYYNKYRLFNEETLPAEYIKGYAKAAAYLNLLNEFNNNKNLRKIVSLSKTEIYHIFCDIINAENLLLPATPNRLYLKLKQYLQEGYDALINKKFGNSNSLKRTDEANDFLISNYALPVKMDIPALTLKYNLWAKQQNELETQNPKLKTLTDKAVYAFLYRPEVKSIWFLQRHGDKIWKKEYEHTLKLKLPSYRDAMWVSDGTKINYFHKHDNSAKMDAIMKVNKVMDVYSECILGYDISTVENYISTFIMYKKAVKYSGHKPAQLLYDGQGGNKMPAMQKFFSSISTLLHFRAKARNPQSKSIESAIYRFQQMMRDNKKIGWAFTGQNIQSTSIDSKANMEYVLKHIKDLPTQEDIRQVMDELVNEWNNTKHPKHDKTRLELYQESINPNPCPVDYSDMVELFWLTNSGRTGEGITYRPAGIKITLDKKDYEFEVYENDRITPKASFHSKYANTKLIIKYDPDDLDHVRLYSAYGDDLRFVDVAYLKNGYARFVGDLTEGMRSDIAKNLKFRNDQKDNTKKKLSRIQERTGISADTLVRMGSYSPLKDELNDAESELILANGETPSEPVKKVKRTKPEQQEKKGDDLWTQLYKKNKLNSTNN